MVRFGHIFTHSAVNRIPLKVICSDQGENADFMWSTKHNIVLKPPPLHFSFQSSSSLSSSEELYTLEEHESRKSPPPGVSVCLSMSVYFCLKYTLTLPLLNASAKKKKLFCPQCLGAPTYAGDTKMCIFQSQSWQIGGFAEKLSFFPQTWAPCLSRRNRVCPSWPPCWSSTSSRKWPHRCLRPAENRSHLLQRWAGCTE